MSNVMLKRSKIEKIVEDHMRGIRVASVEELTDKVWEYLEETMRKVKYPVKVRILEEK